MRQAGEGLGLANHTWIAMKAVLPHLIADHGHWMRAAADVFTRLEPPAEDRPHAKRSEIVRRDHAAGGALGAIADAEGRAGNLLAYERIGHGRGAREI